MDNSGDGPLQVPGFNDIPLYYELPRGSRFAHGIADWRQIPQLTLREVCMLQFMSYVTEQPNWENKCDDPDTLEIWREKADSAFDLDQPCWDWCRKELREKAANFKRKGHVAVFDADSRVIKAEVDASLLADLRTAMEPLFSSTEEPNSEDKEAPVEAGVQGPVRHVVDPSMYPLVYGRTKVFINGGKVNLDSFESCDYSGCQTAPIPDKLIKHPYELNHEERDPYDGRGTNKPNYWSNKFQWLPCEVKFTDRGETKITSYINGVNPREKETYRALERLIDTAIHPWNEMLILGNQGRTPIRIRTYDFQTENEALPQAYNLLWGTTVGLEVRFSEEQWPEIRSQVRDYLNLPEYEQRYQIDPSESNVKDLLASMDPSPTPPPPEPNHQFYTVSLRDHFQGLQVIIRVSSIDLTPERPLYTGEPQFGVAGILNEHIVATTVCYLDMDNIKDPKVSFQQETLLSTLDFNVEKYLIMNRVFDVPEEKDDELPPALQNLGSVSVSQAGELLSWPNTLRSRAEAFNLRDPSQPGRLRFVTLWLVDPHYRICSTQNVPPQDESWVGTSMAHPQEDTQTQKLTTPAEAIHTRKQMNQDRNSSACAFHRYGHGAHKYADDYHAFYYGSREES
ncbi:hypothetical protein ASPACDRAFT_1862977 [Aspergillus aculeatus ATCC 16872]|uniref:Uncharacterized protein n=1 Tax=Aspergillus aculeatus (strain ATCC 16872 / CBS 172.66 / WB 5094) TaxID=690307 RepID=A0A1L9X5I3_ASPA1|nr:uncharacterized protein ASPACDRAFT_1862977 [Aspergillus aculeatus ATCC 16872]OJK03589.1 hypothetical protein ASPACDRAFT_1862977 [Aspergillus aculeatus ATCC 16872]